MKCLYYLAPSLDSTRTISDDLHSIGVKDWFIHVVSNDEAGLKRERIHSSNYIETYDFVRVGLLGAYIGFVVGLVGAFLLMAGKTFGEDAPVVGFVAVIGIATFFGAWVGGLAGMGAENGKLHAFHDDLADGKYLFLIYARKSRIDAIKSMMATRHHESEHVATDEHFVNPFRDPDREKHPAP